MALTDSAKGSSLALCISFGSYLFPVFNEKLSIYSHWKIYITNIPPQWCAKVLPTPIGTKHAVIYPEIMFCFITYNTGSHVEPMVK